MTRLMGLPDGVLNGGQLLAGFGASVETAGDVNGDGISDLIVGSPLHDNGEVDEGSAFIYLGHPTGPVLFVSVEGNQDNAFFGASVATAGDVNGDGFSDVIVGAPGYRSAALDELAEGAAYLYLGSPDPGVFATPDWMIVGDQKSARFGAAVSSAGDVNGDGYSDVIIGEPGYTNTDSAAGRAHLFLGGPGGLSATADWQAEGIGESAEYGAAVGFAGDLDGDGYGDVVVGSPGWVAPLPGESTTPMGGAAFVYHGAESGLLGQADLTLYHELADVQFGSSVATAGDMNGDGYADLVIGAAGSTGDGAGSFIFFGSETGASQNEDYLTFGSLVHTAGDRNGDGYADVVAGIPSLSVVVTVLGGPSALVDDDFVELAGVVGFGVVAPAGDLNGDGFGDLAVGAPGAGGAGSVFLYHGGPGSRSTLTGEILTKSGDGKTWQVDGTALGARLGSSVANVGDVNGDGLGDVILGAPYHDAGQLEGRAFLYHGKTTGLAPDWAWSMGGSEAAVQFGAAVSSAGDVNGDGYDDALIGAPEYPNPIDARGRIVVYSGSASGLSTESFASHVNDEILARMGSVVAPAGDINNDGYTDLLAGSRSQAVAGGGAYAFHGGPNGIDLAWATYSPATFGPASYGASISPAGDLNRDGFLDVIVGSPDFGESFPLAGQGRAEVYLGGSAGLSLDEDWFVVGAAPGERVGESVAGVGDVNFDGYDDVAVGAPGAPFGGQIHVYLGGPTGPQNTIGITFEGDDLPGPGLGTTLSGAGDVNNDGRPDILAGYSDSQISLLVSGSDGESWSDADTVGDAISGGGDINGDGFADVVIGKPAAAPAGLVDAGRAEVLFGNGVPGRSLNVNQRRQDTDMPIAHRGLLPVDEIVLFALGRTPFGRGDVKLEWEIAEGTIEFGTELTDLGLAPTWSDSGLDGAYIDGLVESLQPQSGSGYHWRARVRYNPVTTPYGVASHWLTLTESGWRQLDLRVTDSFQNGKVTVVDATSITAVHQLGSISTPEPVTRAVTNSGGGPLTWTAAANPPVSWLDLAPSGAAAQQPYDAAIPFEVAFDTSGLPDGVYSTSIEVVNANDADDLVSIPVELTVGTKVFQPGDLLEGEFPETGSREGVVSFFGLKGMELRLTYAHTKWKLKTRTSVERPFGGAKSYSVQHKNKPATKKKVKLKHDGLHTIRLEALKGWYKYSILTAIDLPKTAKNYKATKKQVGSTGKTTFDVRALPGATVAVKFKPEDNFTGPMTLSVRDPAGVAYEVSGSQQPFGGGLALAVVPLPSGGCYTFTVGGFKDKGEKVTGTFTITQPAEGDAIVQVPLVPIGD